MKRYKRGLINVLLLLLAACMLFTGCGGKGVESGFKIPAGCLDMPKVYCAYKSEKKVFHIDDVTLDFYYGGIYNEYDLEHRGESYPEFELWFWNDSGDKSLIKEVKENFVSEKYRCTDVSGSRNDGYLKLVYNHSEKLTIPKELLVGESGKIHFMIYGEKIAETDQKIELITGATICYEIDGGNVILSPNK